MRSALDRVMDLLHEPSFKESLRHFLTKTISELYFDPKDFNATDLELARKGLEASYRFELEHDVLHGTSESEPVIARFFNSDVFPRLGEPQPFTFEDVHWVAIAHFRDAITEAEFDQGYERFVRDIRDMLCMGPGMKMGRLYAGDVYVEPVQGEEAYLDEPLLSLEERFSRWFRKCVRREGEWLWHSGEVEFRGRLQEDGRAVRLIVEAYLNFVTTRGIARFLPLLKRVVASAFLSLAGLDPRRDEFAVQSEESPPAEPEVPDEAADSEPVYEWDRPARSILDRPIIQHTLNTYLENYFPDPDAVTGKDAIARRLHNAVRLVVEADQLKNESIALALYFSAVEALVCSRREGIVDELSRNVATLLQPDSAERAAAIRYVKKLYDLRSKTLHGEKITEVESAVTDSRNLAAAIVHAASEWLAYQGRMDDTTDRKSFLEELTAAGIAGRQMIGVPSYLARFITD